MRSFAALALLTLLAPLVPVGPAAADADCVDGVGCLLRLEGRVTDEFGEPVHVCVFAEPTDERRWLLPPFAGIVRDATLTDADGRYRLDLPPGPYRVATNEDFGPGFRCEDTWTSHPEFEHQSVAVQVPSPEPVDFELQYWTWLSSYPPGARPGDNLSVFASVGRGAGDGGTATWTDLASGTSVALSGQASGRLWHFSGDSPIPAERPEGRYDGRVVFEDSQGRTVAELARRYTVDAGPPTIVSTFPAEGETVPLRIRPSITATDAIGLYSGRVVLFRLEPDGTRLFLGATSERFDDEGKMTSRNFTLTPNRSYQALFDVRDEALNLDRRTVGFST